MSSIKDLLNPEPEERPPKPSLSRSLLVPASSPLREKRVRPSKDAALFRPGKPKGEVRYPPFEERSEELLKIHQEFNMHPLGNIADYPRHIPYQSDKKSFQEKTGRDAFNVFHYTFQIPGEDTVWTVMWDYNIGLVRTTHLFKCNGHSKTAPGKVLGNNLGLREICHSITGGSLAAQGYWMPYEAAMAVAATFCWKIRHVLTPLFGPDFPSKCVKPKNGSQANLGQIIIEADIVHRAAQTAEMYRSLEKKKEFSAIVTECPSMTDGTPALSELEPESGTESTPSDIIPARQIYPKISRRSYADSICSGRDSSSEPSYCPSPSSPQSSSFTPVNPPRTSHPIQSVPSPKRFLDHCSRTRRSRMTSIMPSTASEAELMELTPSPVSESGSNDVTMAMESEVSTDSDSESSDPEADEMDREWRSRGMGRSTKRKRPTGRLAVLGSKVGCEITAAHALLNMHMRRARAMNVEESGDGAMESVCGPLLNRSRAPRVVQKRRASM